MDEKGTLYWITGLSGAGKTTLGKALFERLRESKANVVFLDGDMLRAVFGTLHGHSLEERKTLARSYSNLCKMLTDQGIDVVCATMSLFREVHDYNRQNIPCYFEIYIECDFQELIRRDQKGIYSQALRGERNDVIGVTLAYDRPEKCDLVIDNSCQDNIDDKVDMIARLSTRQFTMEGTIL